MTTPLDFGTTGTAPSTRPAPDVGRAPYTASPYYVRESQHWAVVQENQRHDQALWLVGENVMFVLMWHVLDFEAGLVGRCQRCFLSQGAIAEAYGQAAQNKCPDCFGTTFEGGYRARIVRPAIFTDTDEDERPDRRGVIHPNEVGVETTTDFRVRQGDFVFRGDGSRWYLRGPERVTLRTGFGYPSQANDAIGYNHARITVEDPDSVSYLIPPNPATVKTILNSFMRTPEDFSSYEVIRAPLIPVDEP